jgi:hypothetical protein
MMQNLSFSSSTNSLTSECSFRKIYLTDEERNLTFAGIVESFEELKGKIKVSLLNVQVYEYSSSNPLYDLPRISFSRPKDKLYTEEFE